MLLWQAFSGSPILPKAAAQAGPEAQASGECFAGRLAARLIGKRATPPGAGTI